MNYMLRERVARYTLTVLPRVLLLIIKPLNVYNHVSLIIWIQLIYAVRLCVLVIK